MKTVLFSCATSKNCLTTCLANVVNSCQKNSRNFSASFCPNRVNPNGGTLFFSCGLRLLGCEPPKLLIGRLKLTWNCFTFAMGAVRTRWKIRKSLAWKSIPAQEKYAHQFLWSPNNNQNSKHMKTAQLVGNKIIMFLNLFGPENKYFVSSANASDVEGTMAPPPPKCCVGCFAPWHRNAIGYQECAGRMRICAASWWYSGSCGRSSSPSRIAVWCTHALSPATQTCKLKRHWILHPAHNRYGCVVLRTRTTRALSLSRPRELPLPSRQRFYNNHDTRTWLHARPSWLQTLRGLKSKPRRKDVWRRETDLSRKFLKSNSSSSML